MSIDDNNGAVTDDEADGQVPAVLAEVDSTGDDDSEGHVFMGGETAKNPDGDEPTAGIRAL